MNAKQKPAKKAPPAQKLRGGLIKYPGGRTYYFKVKHRGEMRRGDTGCEGYEAAKEWLKAERDGWSLAEKGLEVEKPTATLEEALKAWKKGVRSLFTRKRIDMVDYFITQYAGELLLRPLDQIETNDVLEVLNAYLEVPKEKGRRPHTRGGANEVLKALNTIFNFAIELGLLTHRPYKVKKLDAQPAPKQIVPLERIDDFLNLTGKARNKQARIAALMMYGLGLREKEALQSRAEWLDLDRATYSVGDAKDRDTRVIPVPAWLLEELRKVFPESGRGWLLPNSDGEPYPRTSTRSIVERAGRKLGLHITPHSMRASWATHLDDIDVPIQHIQAGLGHEDSQTTEIYIKRGVRRLAQAQAKLAETTGISIQETKPKARRASGSTTVPPRKRNAAGKADK